jgi:hypothetical protein
MTIDHKIGEWFNDKIYLDKKIMVMDKNQWGNHLIHFSKQHDYIQGANQGKFINK